jgi:hypothetical protein
MDDTELLKIFRREALRVIKEEKSVVKDYAGIRDHYYDRVEQVKNDKEFEEDMEIFFNILKKYHHKGIDLPTLLGYAEKEDNIGYIEIDGHLYAIDDVVFISEAGIDTIMEILDLLEFDYQCNCCLVRATCQKLNPNMGCKKIEEIVENDKLSLFVENVIATICTLINKDENFVLQTQFDELKNQLKMMTKLIESSREN